MAGDYYRVSCDQKFQTINSRELYEDGLCGHCHGGLGARRRQVTRILQGTSRDEVGYTINGLCLVKLFSDVFRDLLIRGGIDPGDFAPAQDEKGRSYYELCYNLPPIPWVGIVSDLGLRAKAVCCPRCQKQAFLVSHKGFPMSISHFIRASDSPRILQPVSMVGPAGCPEPLFSEAYMRWLKTKKIRNIAFDKIGMVPDREAELPLVDCSPIPPRTEPQS